MKKSLLMLSLCGMLFVFRTASAQFTVYDPVAAAMAKLRYWELQLHLAEMQKTVSGVNQTVGGIKRQIAFWEYMAQSLQNMPARFRAEFARWSAFNAPDLYGTMGPWNQATNSGMGVTEAYGQAIVPLNRFADSTMSQMSAEGQQHAIARATTVEQTDGANQVALQTLGDIRARMPEVQQKIDQLEADVMSSDPDQNTVAANQNKSNVASLMLLRSLQDNNKLQAANLEAMLAQNKAKRDEDAVSLNELGDWKTKAGQLLRGMFTGSDSAISNARF